MTKDTHINSIIEAAEEAITSAAFLRRTIRRKTKRGDARRATALTAAIENLEEAMIPIRSEMGRLSFLNLSARLEAKLRQTSLDCQGERKRLLKMLGHW